ncbi:MAG: tetratricopeptide repeat protein [Betaproteobacteria bacterium]|nr:tetratricopeptide repeat protein [Betaproteobacteria bacterium]
MSSEQRTALDTVQLLLLQRTLAAADEAVALSEGVVATSPGASEAWAALAAAWYSRLTFMDREIGPLAERAKQIADQALALNADDPVALRTKAIMVGKYDYDVARAEALFTRALRAMPRYTSARLNYSEVLLLQGRFDEALSETDLALLYDPLSVSVRLARGLCLQYQGRFDEARREWALFRASGEASFWVFTGSGLNELAAGNLDAAERFFDVAVARFPELPNALMCRAYLYATRGEVDRAREQERACLECFPHYSRTDRAMLASLLQDKASTIAHLTAAQSAHDMRFLYASIEPAFAWLASDADFLRVLRRSHVPGWRGRRRA